MFEDCPKVKTRIAKHQLASILATCFNEKEIILLANECGIHYEGRVPSILKDLAAAFFEQALTEDAVSQHLAQKAQGAAHRVGYMDVKEIQTFLKSASQLLENGEFGEVVWALLMDSREAVWQHGYQLLIELESDTVQGREELNIIESPHPNRDEETLLEIQINASPVCLHQHDIAVLFPQELPSPSASADFNTPSASEKIDQLHEEISELRREHTAIQSENNALKQKLQQLVEENQALKELEHQNRENESRFRQLERENKTLRYDLQRLSDQLGEFHRLKLEKAKLAVELKGVEDAAHRSQEAVEQMKLDFHVQLANLQRANEESRAALMRTQQKLANFVSEPNGVAGNRVRMAEQPRVGVFVDVQNMFYAAKDRYAGRLDYIKLLDLIVGPRRLVVAYAYVVQIPEINQAGFLSLLEHNGYTIKSKDLRMRGDGSAKGDWDVGIAIDVVSMLDALDVVILASGDGDFCALAEVIKQQGKRVEVAAFAHNTSMDLQRMADQFFPIGDDLLI